MQVRGRRRVSLPFRTALASALGLSLLLAPPGGRPLARAQGAAAGPAALFGVALGDPAAAVASAQRLVDASCTAAADGSNIVCSPPLSRPPLSAVETLWMRDGRIDQAFLVVDLSLSSRTPFEVDFRRGREWVAATLGAPAHVTPVPDGWSAPAIENRHRFEDLAAGHARLEASWTWRDVGLRLWLASKRRRSRRG